LPPQQAAEADDTGARKLRIKSAWKYMVGNSNRVDVWKKRTVTGQPQGGWQVKRDDGSRIERQLVVH
jgi:hypothetical protein